ncbi:MAG: hypothetical protein ACRD15_18550 [Vicinamibacterales bacterium]
MHPRVTPLAADLQRIFGARLESLVAYGDIDAETGNVGTRDPDGLHTLALVERLTFHDLAACAPLVPAWRRAGIAVPLLLSRDEFLRTLDVFPVEYGGIIARHVVILGTSPFAGMEISEADLRRAYELQAKSHLIHLREGYLESRGEPAGVAHLIAASAPALRSLTANVERLDPGIDDRAGLTPELIREIQFADSSTIADPSALFARYLDAVERLWKQVDGWQR